MQPQINMNDLKKGDCAFYQGIPTHELSNGNLYFIEDIRGDTAILGEMVGDNINSIKAPINELYPFRDAHLLNYEIAHARRECKVRGTWTLPIGEKSNIKLEGLAKFQTEDYLREINLTDIAGQGDDIPDDNKYFNCWCCGGVRFRTADVNKPIVVFSGLENPGGEPYRTMDGHHRFDKRKWLGHTTIMAYVMPFEEVLPYVNW